jgi:site-specific recombinase XerD
MYLTQDQVLDILKVAFKRSSRDYTMLLLAYQHGLRANEIINLRLSDVAQSKLTVQRLKGSLKTEQPLIPNRKNFLLDERKALALWLRIRPEGSDFLFPTDSGKAMSYSRFYQMFREYATFAGVPEELTHPHSLKHAIASHLSRNGMPLDHLKQFLGHAAVSSTIVYTNVTCIEATEAAIKILNGRAA